MGKEKRLTDHIRDTTESFSSARRKAFRQVAACGQDRIPQKMTDEKEDAGGNGGDPKNRSHE